jgi:hypothetical protein
MTRLPAISMSSLMSVELHFKQEAGSYFYCNLQGKNTTRYVQLAKLSTIHRRSYFNIFHTDRPIKRTIWLLNWSVSCPIFKRIFLERDLFVSETSPTVCKQCYCILTCESTGLKPAFLWTIKFLALTLLKLNEQELFRSVAIYFHQWTLLVTLWTPFVYAKTSPCVLCGTTWIFNTIHINIRHKHFECLWVQW